MREIVLDTETTGFDPLKGHRIVEIGCVELINGVPSGSYFQKYINPERDVPESAFRVHGLSRKFLQDFHRFQDVVKEFLDFISSDSLVIHNSAFDIKFLNAELEWAGAPLIQENTIIDTLQIARKKFPGSPLSLDALCRRFDINNTHREKHGALLDSEILSEVYIELMGGRQKRLFSASADENSEADATGSIAFSKKKFEIRYFYATQEEKKIHKKFVQELKDPIWNCIFSYRY